MTKYILVFDKAIRLGLDIAESIGPFDSIKEAEDYFSNAFKTWAITPPNAHVISILDPEA